MTRIEFYQAIIDSNKFADNDPILVYAVKALEKETKATAKAKRAVAKAKREIDEPIAKEIMREMGKTHSTYTIKELMERVPETEGLTPQKVAALLRPYIEKGIVEKDGKSPMGYKRIPMSKVNQGE